MRRERIKLAIIIGVIAAFFVLFNILLVRAILKPSRLSGTKQKEEHGIAHVQAKQVITKEGKVTRRIVFRFGKYLVPKDVDSRTFDSLKKNDRLLMTYVINPDTFQPEVRKWEPLPVEGEPKK